MNTKTVVINNVVALPVKRMISAWKPGQPRKDFESNAVTYGQLKTELRDNGFNLNEVRVSEGHTQIDLVNDDAILPTNINKRGTITNDLVIIMTPQTKIKSGMIDTKTASYKELKAEIKDLCNTSTTSLSAKSHFGNYTQMSTDNMRVFLADWYKKNSKSSGKPAPAPKAKVEAKPVVKEAPKTAPSTPSKFDKVRENLEKKEFTLVKEAFNSLAYNEGLAYIQFGVTQLQNEVFNQVDHSLPSDDELSQMAKRMQ